MCVKGLGVAWQAAPLFIFWQEIGEILSQNLIHESHSGAATLKLLKSINSC